MAKPILYSFRRCPYAIRARLALYVAGIDARIREVVLREKPAQLLDISPKATVPVLQFINGDVLEESLDIMVWALQQADPQHWLEGQNEALIRQNDTDFKFHLDRYKYADRYDDANETEHREACADWLWTLNAKLSKTAYLQGDHLSITDQAIRPFVRQFAFADKPWFDQQKWRALQRWLEDFLCSDLFLSVMPKHRQWQVGDREPGLISG